MESGIWLKSIQPLVISPIPQKMAVNRFLSMPIFDIKEIIKLKSCEDVITSKSTKVKHITPPINKIEFTDETTLAEKSMQGESLLILAFFILLESKVVFSFLEEFLSFKL